MQTIGNLILNPISLYFHIPFCTRKCDYCHFYVIPDNEEAKDKLLQGFQYEWKRYLPFLKNKQVVTLYFGGGTPFLFGPNRLNQVIRLVKDSIDCLETAEITLEANPENVTLPLMQEYKRSGVNRVSLGIQTLDADLLPLLGRLHTPQLAVQAIHTTYQAGIENISVDLMYDLPKQTIKDWTYTLNQVQQLPITHLSLYNLTIEPHTLFFKKQDLLTPLLPLAEESLAMYEMAIEKLEKVGLQQYEISAFAKEGFEAQHNQGYWTGRPFLGLGPSAFSYWEGKRFQNVAHLSKYCKALIENKSPIDFEEKLEISAHRRELLVIHLRLCRGVHLPTFIQLHGELDLTTQNEIKRLIVEGYLEKFSDQLKLTKKGILFYDSVAADLI